MKIMSTMGARKIAVSLRWLDINFPLIQEIIACFPMHFVLVIYIVFVSFDCICDMRLYLCLFRI